MSGKSKKAKSGARWRTVRRKGGTFLKSPDGEYYAGTAAEVRRLGLSPEDRKCLAGSLRVSRMVFATPDTFTERREYAAEARRDAIKFSELARRRDPELRDIEILQRAAARYLGFDSTEDYVRELLRSGLEAAIEAALSDGECDGLPLTRQEAAALTRPQGDYCPALRRRCATA